MSNVATKVTTKKRVKNIESEVITAPIIKEEQPKIDNSIDGEQPKDILISEKEIALIISNYKEQKKKERELNKANESQLSKDRKELNNNVRSELLTFDAVFETTIKQKFNVLTSRPTYQKLAQNIELVSSLLFKTASQKFTDEHISKDTVIHWVRFARLITDKKLLHSFGTKAQKSDGKCWTATSCMDLLLKALISSNQVYENALKVRNQK